MWNFQDYWGVATNKLNPRNSSWISPLHSGFVKYSVRSVRKGAWIDYPTEKTEIEAKAKQVAGVTAVTNALTIAPKPKTTKEW